MIAKNMFTLVNQNGDLAFKTYEFTNNDFDRLQRLSYYSLIWILKGNGKVKTNFSEHYFSNNSLLAFSPYQPFMIDQKEKIEGIVLNFHSDFFCIHKHQHEIACNGVLFNNIYDAPVVKVDEKSTEIFNMLIGQIQKEMGNPGLAQSELLVSYLKIFLITASRLKDPAETTITKTSIQNTGHFVLQNLKNFIEMNYKSMHSPSEYAGLLNISSKALAKITKAHFNKTPTDLISERIIIEAKRELYLTNKTVKEIAYELGYGDEYYFSRFFKNNVAVSPQVFRETVGFGRASVD
ncbi:helix-turn-helix domain-containing protein [Chryseobacterium sp.]|uniref:helix-turn-helix domain-containing protein n=1 Tax=Chryseobacterium sp. TaxID=1871047 RepID=UPI00333F04E4